MSLQNVLQPNEYGALPNCTSALRGRPPECYAPFDRSELHLQTPGVGLTSSVSFHVESQVSYPYGVWHPLYNPSTWRRAPTATKLIYYGMAVEQSFKVARAVTIEPSENFVRAMLASNVAPHAFINKSFHNSGLGDCRRVGVIEYGRKKKRGKFPEGREDRIHLHFWIDASGYSENLIRSRMVRCFSFGKNDLPSSRRSFPYMVPMRWEPSKAAPPFNLAETGGVGWLLYAALRNKQTRRFLNISLDSVDSFRSKFGRHFDRAYEPRDLNSLHFPEIVFSDAVTAATAKKIHQGSILDEWKLYRRLFELDDLNNDALGFGPYEEVDYDPRYRQ